MKNRIKLHLAMVAALAAATLHRVTHPNALALGNEAAPPPPVDLEKENADLKKKVAKLEAAVPKYSALIKDKMAAGLSREQAEAAIKKQASFDARKKEVAKN